MSSKEKSKKSEDSNPDAGVGSDPSISEEKPSNNNIINESNEKGKKKDKSLLGKKTERSGKKTNNDYCSSCLKKGNLLKCNECERSYHKKCLKSDEKDIPDGAWLCPICVLKRDKKEKKNKKIKKEIKKEVKKEVKKVNKKDIKKKENVVKKKIKENIKDNKESNENEEQNDESENEEMENNEDNEQEENNENNETTEKNESNENEENNESNEKEENAESNENENDEDTNKEISKESETSKKKKINKKKTKKNAKKIDKVPKKNTHINDKNDKTEKREKTPDKTKKSKAEKTPNKDKQEKEDKFAITNIRSKRLQERQKQKEKLEKEKLEKEKLEKEKEKDKTPEKDKKAKTATKKKGLGRPKKNTEKSNNETQSTENSKGTNKNEEEIYSDNTSSKTSDNNIKFELLAFFRSTTLKEIKSTPFNKLNLSDEILSMLKDSESLKKINSMLLKDRDFQKYKNISSILIEKCSSPQEKHSHHRTIHYPISCKDLYNDPKLHNLEEKYLHKTEGILYPYFNGKTFNRVIGIYDFLSTFANKIYLDQFSLEELYSALLNSESYTKSEISLLSYIHVSLCYLLISELMEYPIQDLYSNGETDLLMVKEVIENKRDDLNKIYAYIYYTWPELVRLFLKSKTFSINIGIYIKNELSPILDKIYHCKDVISYNTNINFEEKLLVLENLVVISYETNFIREIVKEANDSLNKYRKQIHELEDELKYLDSRKTEFERHNKLTQPQNRIDEINKKLSELGENKTRSGGDKMRLKLENERQILEDMLREMGENNTLRDETIIKIKDVKTELFDIQTVGRTDIGMDGRGYKYFYFNWIPKVIFIRVKKKHIEEKFEWRIINDLDILNNDLIDKLSEKGIEEADLKSNLEIIYKKLTNKNKKANESKENKIIMDEENPNETENDKNKEKVDEDVEMKDETNNGKNKDKENNDNNEDINTEKKKEEFNYPSLDYIFDNQVLKYENSLNPNITFSSNASSNNTSTNKQYKIVLITNELNQYEPLCDRIKKLEINMTKYLCLDNRQWESQANRAKIKSWIPSINSISNLINILLFFHERIKIPYKSETLSFADFIFGKSATRKIIEEEKEEDESEGETKNKSCPLLINGNLDPNYVNRDLSFGNRIKLWTKEFETFNIERIYLNYLKKVKSIPQILICINLFEMMVVELTKRREFCKRKGDNFIPEIVKNDENKNNGENAKDSYNKIVIKKPDVKKRKLIQWNVKCMYCHEFGELLCCEECPNVTHLSCAKLTKLPEAWKCSFCVDNMKI